MTLNCRIYLTLISSCGTSAICVTYLYLISRNVKSDIRLCKNLTDITENIHRKCYIDFCKYSVFKYDCPKSS